MGPVVLLTILVGSNTFLELHATSKIPDEEFIGFPYNESIKVVVKQQQGHSTNELIEDDLLTLIDVEGTAITSQIAVEDNATDSQNTVKNLEKQVGLLEVQLRSLRDELNAAIGQLREKSALQETKVHLLEETSISRNVLCEEESLAIKRRLGDVQRTVEQTDVHVNRLQSAVESLEFWKLTQSNLTTEWGSQVSLLRSSTAESLGSLQLAFNEWELGGRFMFDVKKATGVWFWIEWFVRRSPATSLTTCEEWEFSLTGTTIGATNRWRTDGLEGIRTYNWTLHTLLPQHWIGGGRVSTWLKTDYDNYGILMECGNRQVSSCNFLWILSRQRNIAEETLEMLKNVAEERGFPKSHGRVYNQTSC